MTSPSSTMTERLSTDEERFRGPPKQTRQNVFKASILDEARHEKLEADFWQSKMGASGDWSTAS